MDGVEATFEEFLRFEIRVGRVLSAEPLPRARHPAYRMAIDFGPAGVKRSSARLTDFYRPEDLVGRQVVAVVNFPPKRVAGFVSEVLVLGVYTEGGVALLVPDRACRPGDRVG